MQNWYDLKDTDDVVTPSLLVYPDRIEKNILRMITMAGGTDLLRPHIKTHKTAEITKMQMAHGIQKFKCATIPEAQLLGECGAKDILLAMQPVGANIGRFLDLISTYSASTFSTIVDNLNSLSSISNMAKARNIEVALYLDLNTGMNRTGIVPGKAAAEVFKAMASATGIRAKGLHAYDGHLRHTDALIQKKECDAAFNGVIQLKELLASEGYPIAHIVAGGSPTFPIHTKRPGVEASPGTTLLWDQGYHMCYRIVLIF